ncbi:MAG: hypothetical protein HFH68_14930 [Lachnospiraceae bacterium]|nr:hypothetical protein [Lachnospiraceae bacterium]
MDNKYETVYKQFEKNFREEAEGFITEEDIKGTLQMEHVRFSNAEKYNIPINKFAGSSLARYTKDMLRQRQPLFFIYYILSQATSFFYFLLIWGTIKCLFLYLTGINKEAFTVKIPMSLPVIFFAVVIVCNAFIQFYTRKILYSCKGSVKKRISIFNISCYFISAIIVVLSAMFLYLGKENYLSLHLSLFQIFIAAAAMLSVSGIHNVIYSSNSAPFVAICYAIMLHKVQETDRAVSEYIQSSLKTFLLRQKISISSYNDNNQMQTEYKTWLRSHIVTLRAYGAIAFFIIFMLAIICLRQLVITGVSAGLAIFSITVLAITVMLFIGILSCNQILKHCRNSM